MNVGGVLPGRARFICYCKETKGLFNKIAGVAAEPHASPVAKTDGGP